MSDFVDLALGKKTPFSFHKNSITSIVTSRGGQNEGDKTTAAVYDEEQGQLLYVEIDDYDAVTKAALASLKSSGVDLFTLPFVWGDDKDIGHHHVNPKAVQSIMVSDPVQKDGQDEPSVGLLADVRGYGRVETYDVPVSVAEKFVSAVEAVNDNLMRFESKEYSSRWYGEEGYTIIDTSQIRDARPNGYDIDLYFYNGARVDFSLDIGGQSASQAADDYLNRLVKRIQGESGTRDDLLKAVGGNLNNLMPRLSRFEDRYRRKLREEFAAAVACRAPQLHRVKEAKDVFYIDPRTVGMLVEQEKSLSVRFKKAASEQYPDSVNVWCEGDASIKAAKEGLLSTMQRRSP